MVAPGRGPGVPVATVLCCTREEWERVWNPCLETECYPRKDVVTGKGPRGTPAAGARVKGVAAVGTDMGLRWRFLLSSDRTSRHFLPLASVLGEKIQFFARLGAGSASCVPRPVLCGKLTPGSPQPQTSNAVSEQEPWRGPAPRGGWSFFPL